MTKECIIVRFIGGTHIENAIRDAVILAMQENCTVKFRFNGSTYTADPTEIRGILHETQTKEDSIKLT